MPLIHREPKPRTEKDAHRISRASLTNQLKYALSDMDEESRRRHPDPLIVGAIDKRITTLRWMLSRDDGKKFKKLTAQLAAANATIEQLKSDLAAASVKTTAAPNPQLSGIDRVLADYEREKLERREEKL